MGRVKVQPRKYSCIFYSFELNLCGMVEIFSQNIVCVLFFDFTFFFGGKNESFPLKQYVNFHCLSLTLGVFDIPVQRAASLLASATDRKLKLGPG